jgi:two-component system response regulator DegU
MRNNIDNISIIVVDDHPLFRQGVIDALNLEIDFRLLGEASTGEEGLSLIRSLKPMVAVIDVNLPELNGQQLTRKIVAEKLQTRVVLLTAYDDTEQKIYAMRVGAAAYCTKDVRPEELVNIIREVAAGKFVIGEQSMGERDLKRWLSDNTNHTNGLYSDVGEPYQPLSAREMEVLANVTRGMSNKEIALVLGISHQTVKNHVTSILRKLGVEDRTQATIYALRRGWVRLYPNDTDSQE